MAETTTTTTTPLHNTHRNFFGQINVVIIGMRYYFSQQQEQLNNLSSCHAVLAFIVPVLLNFLQLKYQKLEISPFETHPKSMSVAIASLLMYCLAYDAELRFSASQRTQTYARRGVVVFGWFGLVSLASILLPDSVGPLLYSLYVLFSSGELLSRRLQMLWKWVHRIIMGRVPLMLQSRLTAHSFSNTGAVPRPRV
ncbi:hypothetical protein ACSBR1_041416 [Camellia fascicularis]